VHSEGISDTIISMQIVLAVPAGNLPLFVSLSVSIWDGLAKLYMEFV
jgi:hypothetical protein